MTKQPALQLPVSQVLKRPGIGEQLRQLGVAVEYFPNYVNPQLRLHRVDCVLLSFVLRGKGSHYLGEDVFPESAGTLSITHYGQYHDIVTGPGGMDVLNIYLDLAHHPLPRLGAPLNTVLGDLLPHHPAFRNRLNRMVRIFFADTAAPAAHLFNIIQELQERPPGYQTSIQHHLALFLILCCREAMRTGVALSAPAAASSTNPPASVPRLEKLRQSLDAEFAKPHALPDLARRVGMTPGSLCRAFRHYTGLSISQYLVRRRIQEALLRLRSTDDKIMSIALACGFHDLSYFNRTFKRLLGRTPGACRGER